MTDEDGEAEDDRGPGDGEPGDEDPIEDEGGDDEADRDDGDGEADRDDGDGEDLSEGEGADDEDEDAVGPEPRADGPSRRRAGPRPIHVAVVVVAFVGAGTYAFNGSANLRAREAVVERCLAEDERLQRTIAERSELRLPVSDWMVSLYNARRRYATELCDRTLEELVWYRWNLGRSIEVDVSRASAQEISEVLEEAAASCEDEVRTLEEELGRHIEERGPSPLLVARVREVTAGQLEACAELRRAVSHSRPGFWPPLRAESVATTAEALAELMPQVSPSEEGDLGEGSAVDE